MSQLGNMDVRDIPWRLGEIMTNMTCSVYKCQEGGASWHDYM